jgi:hypothetical protein
VSGRGPCPIPSPVIDVSLPGLDPADSEHWGSPVGPESGRDLARVDRNRVCPDSRRSVRFEP